MAPRLPLTPSASPPPSFLVFFLLSHSLLLLRRLLLLLYGLFLFLGYGPVVTDHICRSPLPVHLSCIGISTVIFHWVDH
jgi:hypothetical protein